MIECSSLLDIEKKLSKGLVVVSVDCSCVLLIGFDCVCRMVLLLACFY